MGRGYRVESVPGQPSAPQDLLAKTEGGADVFYERRLLQQEATSETL